MNQFWRRPILRLLLAGLASLAFIFVTLILFFVQPMAATVGVTALELASGVNDEHLRDCVKNADTFKLVMGKGIEFWAIPEDLSESPNPNAPKLPARLRAQAKLLATKPAVIFARKSAEGLGGASLLPGTSGTDCAWLLATFPYQAENRVLLANHAVITVAIATLGALFLYAWIAIFPLYRRLRRLATASELIGTSEWSRPDETPDAFGRLAEVLESSHLRLLEEKEADTRARQALETHLSSVAHDLRTPLTAIQLALEEARRDILAGRDPEAALLAAEQDTSYLVLLTENLRLASSLTDGVVLEEGRFRLDQVASRVAQRFERLGRQRKIEVLDATGDVERWSLGNAVLAEQTIANLVHNAVIHHDGEGHVALVLEADEDRFILTVSDDGPGIDLNLIPPGDISLDTLVSRSAQSGTNSGLGLQIVMICCAKLGWEIQINQVNPRGASFQIEGKLLISPS